MNIKSSENKAFMCLPIFLNIYNVAYRLGCSSVTKSTGAWCSPTVIQKEDQSLLNHHKFSICKKKNNLLRAKLTPHCHKFLLVE